MFFSPSFYCLKLKRHFSTAHGASRVLGATSVLPGTPCTAVPGQDSPRWHGGRCAVASQSVPQHGVWMEERVTGSGADLHLGEASLPRGICALDPTSLGCHHAEGPLGTPGAAATRIPAGETCGCQAPRCSHRRGAAAGGGNDASVHKAAAHPQAFREEVMNN